MNSSRVSSLFSETREALFSSLDVLLLLLLLLLLLEESSLSESGYILCSGRRALLSLESTRGSSYQGTLTFDLGLVWFSVSVVVFDSMTLVTMLHFLGVPEAGVWGPEVEASVVRGSDGIRCGEVELRVEASPVFVWESLGSESRVWESVGSVSEVKVAVVIGSGARGYEEREFGVKGSEKTMSGVSG